MERRLRKSIAWIICLSLILSTFTGGMTVSYARHSAGSNSDSLKISSINGESSSPAYGSDDSITITVTGVEKWRTVRLFDNDTEIESEYAKDKSISFSVNLSSEGEHSFTAREVVSLFNVKLADKFIYYFDKSCPSQPNIVFSSPTGYISGNSTNQNVVFQVSGASDEGSGIEKYEYRLNDGLWIECNSDITITEEGTTTINARAKDKAGNTSEISSATVIINTSTDGVQPTTEPETDTTTPEPEPETETDTTTTESKKAIPIDESKMDTPTNETETNLPAAQPETVKLVGPSASPAGGSFNNPQSVTLIPAADAVSTYYTIDGSEPDNSKLYYQNTPINIDAENGVTIVLKAVSYDSAGNKGKISSYDFYFDKEAARLMTPDKPSFSEGNAAWNKVANASGYIIKLYKEDKLIVSKDVYSDIVSYDFTSEISNIGIGNFYVTVTAHGTGAYCDSEESLKSELYTISPMTLKQAKEKIKSIAQQPTITSEDIKKVYESTDLITNSLGSSDNSESERVESITTAADCIGNYAKIIGNINDSEASSTLIKKVSNQIDTMAVAAASTKDEDNTVSVISGMASTVENSASLLENIKEKDAQEAVSDKIIKLFDTAAASTKNITAESKTIEMSDELIKMLASTDEIAKSIKDESKKQKLLEKSVDIIKPTDKAMDKITSPEKSLHIAEKVIENTSDIIQDSDTAQADKITEQVTKIADKAIEKVGTATIESSDTGNTVKMDVTNILNKTNEVIAAKDSLEEKLEKGNINKKLISKVVINVTGEETSNIQAVMPSDVLDVMHSKGLEKIELSSGLASIATSPTNLDVNGKGSFSVIIKKVDKEKDLTENQRTTAGDSPVYEFVAFSEVNGNKQDISSFNKPIEIEVPYTLKAGEDPEKLRVMVYAEDAAHLENPNDISKLNTWQPVGGKYDAETGTIKFNRKTFSMYTIMHIDKSFDDLANYQWAKKDIEVMASKGLVMGKTASKFDPSASVTRAEFTAIIVRTLGLMDSSAKVYFNDVKTTDWYYTAIASAYKEGLIRGVKCSKFEPNSLITRQEMMVIVANAMDKALGINSLKYQDQEKVLSAFKDNSKIDRWARGATALCLKQNIIKGAASYVINPKSSTSRAETAVIIKRLYDLI